MPPKVTRSMLTLCSSVRSGVYIGANVQSWPAARKRGGQRVAVQATAAIHASRPRRKIDDFHEIAFHVGVPDCQPCRWGGSSTATPSDDSH